MFRRPLPMIAALAIVVASCAAGGETGDSLQPSATTTTSQATTTTEPASTTTSILDNSGFPVTIDAPNGPVTIEEKPERIVSISPTSTEVLFAIGAGPQVVAVDDQSNFPTGAPVSELSGFAPSIEAIASFNPDLVFLSFDPGEVIAGLDALGIPVILHGGAVTVADAYGQWEQVGASTGNFGAAALLVAQTERHIGDANAKLPEETSDVNYYWELDQTYYSVTSSTFIGDLLSGTMMSNIADDADPDGYGYPQLTAEYIVASDPELVLLADTKCCGQDATTVAERPGWDTMTAVQNGQIVELDDDIASRWGPRIAELVDLIVASILELVVLDA